MVSAGSPGHWGGRCASRGRGPYASRGCGAGPPAASFPRVRCHAWGGKPGNPKPFARGLPLGPAPKAQQNTTVRTKTEEAPRVGTDYLSPHAGKNGGGSKGLSSSETPRSWGLAGALRRGSGCAGKTLPPSRKSVPVKEGLVCSGW